MDLRVNDDFTAVFTLLVLNLSLLRCCFSAASTESKFWEAKIDDVIQITVKQLLSLLTAHMKI
jgi:hypothetical protein